LEYQQWSKSIKNDTERVSQHEYFPLYARISEFPPIEQLIQMPFPDLVGVATIIDLSPCPAHTHMYMQSGENPLFVDPTSQYPNPRYRPVTT
jgi:hypothetical protein